MSGVAPAGQAQGWLARPEIHDRFAHDLQADLADGTWDRRHGQLRRQPTFDGSLILVTSAP
jgi:hypothetical protein